MVECCKKAQESLRKKGIEGLKTPAIRLLLRIILTIAVTIFLIFYYRLFSWWILGGAVALVLGHLWITSFLKVVRNCIYCYAKKNEEEIDDVFIRSLAVPAAVVGVAERIFFGTLVAFDISATAAAMVTWILVKMVTDWNRILASTGKWGPRSLAFSSLLANIISLFFALIGGLICRKALPYF